MAINRISKHLKKHLKQMTWSSTRALRMFETKWFILKSNGPLLKEMTGADLTNIIKAAFAPTDPKSVKRHL